MLTIETISYTFRMYSSLVHLRFWRITVCRFRCQ